MDIYRVTFAGHRIIYGCRSLEDELEKIVKRILKNKDYVEFYLGRNGDFDILVASAVKRAQKAFDNKSSLILVQPYTTKDDEYYANFYDEIIYPLDRKTYHKAAITKRNEWMVDQSDMIIAFVTNDFGGAAATLRYAESKGIEIMNIAEE